MVMARIDCDPFDREEFLRWQYGNGHHRHGERCDHCWAIWFEELLFDFAGEEHREPAMADWD